MTADRICFPSIVLVRPAVSKKFKYFRDKFKKEELASNPSCLKFWTIYGLYLFSSIVLFIWYDSAVISSLGGISRDSAGNIVLTHNGQPIYPFTFLAAIIGVLGTAYYVWRAVGGVKGVVLGLIVGRAATLAFFEIY
ncbi:hypothetical protein HRbin01_00270 [archaeon HR01]|nr:hypothetical protein HRbin01_00270 [archaeon HR01]